MFNIRISDLAKTFADNFPVLRPLNDIGAFVCKQTKDWGGSSKVECGYTRTLIDKSKSEITLQQKIEAAATATGPSRSCMPLVLTGLDLSPVEYIGTALGAPTRFLCADAAAGEIIDTFRGTTHVVSPSSYRGGVTF